MSKGSKELFKENKFGIRKFTIGAASIIIGTTFYIGANHEAKADELSENQQSQQDSNNNINDKDDTQVQQNTNEQTKQEAQSNDNQTEQTKQETQSDTNEKAKQEVQSNDNQAEQTKQEVQQSTNEQSQKEVQSKDNQTEQSQHAELDKVNDTQSTRESANKTQQNESKEITNNQNESKEIQTQSLLNDTKQESNTQSDSIKQQDTTQSESQSKSQESNTNVNQQDTSIQSNPQQTIQADNQVANNTSNTSQQQDLKVNQTDVDHQSNQAPQTPQNDDLVDTTSANSKATPQRLSTYQSMTVPSVRAAVTEAALSSDKYNITSIEGKNVKGNASTKDTYQTSMHIELDDSVKGGDSLSYAVGYQYKDLNGNTHQINLPSTDKNSPQQTSIVYQGVTIGTMTTQPQRYESGEKRDFSLDKLDGTSTPYYAPKADAVQIVFNDNINNLKNVSLDINNVWVKNQTQVILNSSTAHNFAIEPGYTSDNIVRNDDGTFVKVKDALQVDGKVQNVTGEELQLKATEYKDGSNSEVNNNVNEIYNFTTNTRDYTILPDGTEYISPDRNFAVIRSVSPKKNPTNELHYKVVIPKELQEKADFEFAGVNNPTHKITFDSTSLTPKQLSETGKSKYNPTTFDDGVYTGYTQYDNISTSKVDWDTARSLTTDENGNLVYDVTFKTKDGSYINPSSLPTYLYGYTLKDELKHSDPETYEEANKRPNNQKWSIPEWDQLLAEHPIQQSVENHTSDGVQTNEISLDKEAYTLYKKNAQTAPEGAVRVKASEQEPDPDPNPEPDPEPTPDPDPEPEPEPEPEQPDDNDNPTPPDNNTDPEPEPDPEPPVDNTDTEPPSDNDNPTPPDDNTDPEQPDDGNDDNPKDPEPEPPNDNTDPEQPDDNTDPEPPVDNTDDNPSDPEPPNDNEEDPQDPKDPEPSNPTTPEEEEDPKDHEPNSPNEPDQPAEPSDNEDNNPKDPTHSDDNEKTETHKNDVPKDNNNQQPSNDNNTQETKQPNKNEDHKTSNDMSYQDIHHNQAVSVQSDNQQHINQNVSTQQNVQNQHDSEMKQEEQNNDSIVNINQHQNNVNHDQRNASDKKDMNNKTKENTLPETGNESQNSGILASILLALGLGGLLSRRKKSE